MIKFTIFICLLIMPFLAYSKEVSSYVIGCKQEGNVRKIKLNGKVLLNQNFSDSGQAYKKEALYQQAIELQIKHLLGFYRTTKSNGLNVSLSSYRQAIKILKVEGTKYGFDLKIDDYMAPERSFQSSYISNYLKAALARGVAKASDDAELIEYETELMVADCSQGPFLQAVKVILPIDPFMSFWIDNPEERKLRIFNGKKNKFVSNCLSSEIIDFGSFDQNWFFWSPIDAKKDAQHNEHFCKSISDRAVYVPQISLGASIPGTDTIKKDFFSGLKIPRFYGIFGKISDSNYFIKADMKEYLTLIQNNFQKCNTQTGIHKCLKTWNESLASNKEQKLYEPGFYFFVEFLRDLNQLMKLKSWKIINSSSNREIILKISAQLLVSEKPIEVMAYFGTTTLDYGPPPSKRYAEFLHDALENADLVSYLGHSGLGTNVSMNKFSEVWRNNGLKPVKRNRPLWFGIYNCEGYSYYGFDQESIFKDNKVKLLLTMSTGVEAEAKFPLAQIFTFDKILSSETGISIKDLFGRYVHTRDFYVGTLVQ